MKRGLVERAKQSSLPSTPPRPNGIETVADHRRHRHNHHHHHHHSSSLRKTAQHPPDAVAPPSKIPRIDRIGEGGLRCSGYSAKIPQSPRPTVRPKGGGSSSGTTVSTSVSAGSKRQRPTSGHVEDEQQPSERHPESPRDLDDGGGGGGGSKRKKDRKEAEQAATATGGGGGKRGNAMIEDEVNNDDDDASRQTAFYLKHQNRALATELNSLRFSVRQLESERGFRRRKCLEAIKALDTLQAVWTRLETAMLMSNCGGTEVQPPPPPPSLGDLFVRSPATEQQQQQQQVPPSSPAVVSSGSGADVESTAALARALDALAEEDESAASASRTRRRGRRRSGESSPSDEDEEGEEEHEGHNNHEAELSELSHFSENIARRASVLQRWIWSILQQQSNNGSPGAMSEKGTSVDESSSSKLLLERAVELQERVSHWEGESRLKESQIEELAASRDASLARERRLRRNIFRLSSGIMTAQQVIKSLEPDEDNDGDIQAAVEREVQLQQKQQQQEVSSVVVKHEACAAAAAFQGSSAGANTVKLEGELSSRVAEAENPGSQSVVAVGGGCVKQEVTEISLASEGKLQEVEGKLEDLENLLSKRELTIQELTDGLKEKELEVTRLRVKQLSDEDAAKLVRLESTRLQLEAKEHIQQDLQRQLNGVKEQWAQALGNEQAIKKAMEELVQKHNKRWSELVSDGEAAVGGGGGGDGNSNNISDASAMTAGAAADDENNAAACLRVRLQRQRHEIVQLQHKLRQAVEHVRHAETSKENLKTTVALNAHLQQKFDELKTKYAAACAAASQNQQQQQSASSSSNNNNSSSSPREKVSSFSSKDKSSSSSSSQHHQERRNASSADGSNSRSSSNVSQHERRSGSSGVSNSRSSSDPGTSSRSSDVNSSGKSDKLLQVEKKYRGVKKDLAACMASKESAKTKLAAAERERDGLYETNRQLMKQVAEKDEMNTKSLSTILHLKSMTDQAEKERENLKQAAASASQLALAARLAANAKERVSEQVLKENETLKQRLEELESKQAETSKELQKVKTEFSEAAGKVMCAESAVVAATQRSDELVQESAKRQEEIRTLERDVFTAQRQAREAKQKLECVGGSGSSSAAHQHALGAGKHNSGETSGGSAFTVDQLNMQVSVLKQRLACPVCHYRDKSCIIMRCRHMHCKQCVEERLSNRSRKCPTCNNKFSEKDVEDIWLN